MPELNDLSGPFRPDLTFEDFSKEFLLKLMKVWQFVWLWGHTAWYEWIVDRLGIEEADKAGLAAMTRMAETVNPRYAGLAGVQLNTVVDSLKILALPLDNTVGGLFPVQYDIKNDNHVILTVKQCRNLLGWEKMADTVQARTRIDFWCRVAEKPILQRYLVNSRIRVTPLQLPPRSSPEEIACRWELKIED